MSERNLSCPAARRGPPPPQPGEHRRAADSNAPPPPQIDDDEEEEDDGATYRCPTAEAEWSCPPSTWSWRGNRFQWWPNTPKKKGATPHIEELIDLIDDDGEIFVFWTKKWGDRQCSGWMEGWICRARPRTWYVLSNVSYMNRVIMLVFPTDWSPRKTSLYLASGLEPAIFVSLSLPPSWWPPGVCFLSRHTKTKVLQKEKPQEIL
jgi:hypothetical protein